MGFPKQPSRKSPKFSKMAIAIVGVVIILAVGGFALFWVTGNSDSNEGSSLGIAPTPTSAPTSTPTPTPEVIDKKQVKVEILNGTGTAGDAGRAQSELEDLGYSNIEVGNADEQDETRTTVTHASNIGDESIDEIVEALEKVFEDVVAKRGTATGGFDISITTGPRLRGAATPTPSSSSEPADEATGSGTNN